MGDAIQSIVDCSLLRNEKLEVTGALLCSNGLFTQLLEGPGAAIDELMRSISIDIRHTDVTVLARRETIERELDEWRLAFWGDADFLEKKVQPLVGCKEAAQLERGFDALKHIIVAFARSY